MSQARAVERAIPTHHRGSVECERLPHPKRIPLDRVMFRKGASDQIMQAHRFRTIQRMPQGTFFPAVTLGTSTRFGQTTSFANRFRCYIGRITSHSHPADSSPEASRGSRNGLRPADHRRPPLRRHPLRVWFAPALYRHVQESHVAGMFCIPCEIAWTELTSRPELRELRLDRVDRPDSPFLAGLRPA